MKNLIIFLHGKGGHKDSLKYKIIKDIAKKRNAEIIGINAISPHRDGYKWFDKTVRLSTPEVYNQFKNSFEYIKEHIDIEIKKRKITYNDVILCGHSQGALMAIYFGLTLGAKSVIALFGGIHESLIKNMAFKNNVPIYWIEAGEDNVLDDDVRQSYKDLKSKGVDVKYFISKNSTHDTFDWDILDFI